MSDTFDDDGGVPPDESSLDCIEDDANFPAGADGDDDSVRVLTSPRRHGDVEAPADDSDRWSKVGRVPSEGVGAETVDEPAPQLNRRFFLGLDGDAARDRAERARERRREARMADEPTAGSEGRVAEEGGGERARSEDEGGRRRSSVFSSVPRLARAMTYNSNYPIPARLVSSDQEHTVYEAEPMGKCERNWKANVACILVLSVLAIAMGIVLSLVVLVKEANTDRPTVQPTGSPTHDQRPTLQIVEERGVVKCGSNDGLVSDLNYLWVCKFVASVLFGNSSKFEAVSVIGMDRFEVLQSRKADLLVSSDTHVVEREIKEPTTGVGFAFSTPYIYSGLKYLGDEEMVRCAEEEKRFDECSRLFICASGNGTHAQFIKSKFPSGFYTTLAQNELDERYLDGTCNTVLHDFPRAWLYFMNASDEAAASTVASTYIGTEILAIE